MPSQRDIENALLARIAEWVEKLDETSVPNDRGLGHTTEYLDMSKERLARLIRARSWEHAKLCAIHTQFPPGECTCFIPTAEQQQAKRRRDEQIDDLRICECEFPVRSFRNGSGHASDCPTHAKWLEKKR